MKVKYTKLPKKDALIVEYQKAQESAEHYDKLIWTVTSIFITVIAVILGYSFNKELSIIKLSFNIIGALGIILFLFTIIKHMHHIKNVKYKRCKEIEDMLAMKQHNMIQKKATMITGFLAIKLLLIFVIGLIGIYYILFSGILRNISIEAFLITLTLLFVIIALVYVFSEL